MLSALNFKIKGMNESGKAFAAIKNDLRSVDGVLASVGARARRTGKNLRNLGAGMSLAVTAPALLGFKSILGAAGDFEKAMNNVRAISGATGGDFQKLDQLARDLGASTKFSATQAADAMGFLAMAGFETDAILGSMPSTLQLAAAANLELADSADIVSNILTGYRKDVSELPAVTDALVTSLTSANTDLLQLGEAMVPLGPIASSAGFRFNEMTAAIGMLGNAGIQGEKAGNTLKRALANLLDPTPKITAELERLGVSVYDSGGGLRDLTSILSELQPHAGDTAAILRIFGKVAGPGMAALLSQGSDALRTFEEQLNQSAGTAGRIATEQMKGLNGALISLNSAYEGLKIAIGASGILEWTTNMTKGLTEFVRGLTETNPQILKWGTLIVGAAAALGPFIAVLGLAVIGVTAFTAALAPIAIPLAIVAGLLGTGAALFTVFGANSANAGTATDGFNAQLETNKIKMLGAATGTKAYREELVALMRVQGAAASTEAERIGTLLDVRNEALNAAGSLIGPNTAFVDNNIKIIAAERDKILSEYKAAVKISNSFVDQIRQVQAISGASGAGVKVAVPDIETPEITIPGGGSGGGGGGSAASGVDTLSAAYEQLRASLDPAYQSANELAKAQAVINAAMDAGIISREQAELDLAALDEKYNVLTESMKRSRDNMVGFFKGILTGAKSAKDAIGELIAKLADRMLTSGLESLFSGLIGGGSGDLLNFLFNANGNAFQNGSVTAFATGGVVSSATAFPMRGGVGVMGEAGPEAIMPLTRIGGKLGVQSAGGGRGKMTVVVRMEQNGELGAFIEEVSGPVAARVTSAGLEQYSRHVAPNLQNQISKDPRRIG